MLLLSGKFSNKNTAKKTLLQQLIYLHKKIGEKVKTGESLATLYTNKKETLENVAELVLPAWTIGTKRRKQEDVVVEIL